MALFEARQLHKRFGDQVVLENISLTFEEGQLAEAHAGGEYIEALDPLAVEPETDFHAASGQDVEFVGGGSGLDDGFTGGEGLVLQIPVEKH